MEERTDAEKRLDEAQAKIESGLAGMAADMTSMRITILAIANALKRSSSFDMNLLMMNMQAGRQLAKTTNDDLLLACVDRMIEGLEIEDIVVNPPKPAPSLRLVPTDQGEPTPKTDE